jgi:hypothetical protein
MLEQQPDRRRRQTVAVVKLQELHARAIAVVAVLAEGEIVWLERLSKDVWTRRSAAADLSRQRPDRRRRAVRRLAYNA